METSKEEEVKRVIKAALLVVGAGPVDSAIVNMKRPGVFVGVFKDRKMLMELGYFR